MVRRQRLDRELVRRQLARSRQHATDLITARRVLVGGTIATKSTTMVEESAPVIVKTAPDGEPEYVSRGGHKLAGAVAVFKPQGLVIAGKYCLDAGASTGGFTDVLLRAGAAHVVAADVGYGQLAWSLQQDERVTVLDRTNVRFLARDDLARPAEIVVSDLSFISLKTVLPALANCGATGADYLLMVKPIFVVCRVRLSSGGVVTSVPMLIEAIAGVAERARELGLGVRDVACSPLPGPSGNVEYFLWLRKPEASAVRTAGEDGYLDSDRLLETIKRAVAEGPK